MIAFIKCANSLKTPMKGGYRFLNKDVDEFIIYWILYAKSWGELNSKAGHNSNKVLVTNIEVIMDESYSLVLPLKKGLIRVSTGMGTLLVIGFYTSICKSLRIIDNTADKSLVVHVFLNLLGTKIMQKLRKRMNCYLKIFLHGLGAP
nr:hypothetical protein CFP56_72972 [Quercus suber]